MRRIKATKKRNIALQLVCDLEVVSGGDAGRGQGCWEGRGMLGIRGVQLSHWLLHQGTQKLPRGDPEVQC